MVHENFEATRLTFASTSRLKFAITYPACIAQVRKIAATAGEKYVIQMYNFLSNYEFFCFSFFFLVFISFIFQCLDIAIHIFNYEFFMYHILLQIQHVELVFSSTIHQRSDWSRCGQLVSSH